MIVTSIRLPKALQEQLEALAQATGRSRNYLMTEALQQYVEEKAWLVAQIEEGLRDAEEGRVLSEEETEAFLDRLTRPEQLNDARREVEERWASS
jgi:predicted transcriptional regulator